MLPLSSYLILQHQWSIYLKKKSAVKCNKRQPLFCIKEASYILEHKWKVCFGDRMLLTKGRKLPPSPGSGPPSLTVVFI